MFVLLLSLLCLISSASATQEDVVLKKALKSKKVFTGLLNSYLQNYHKHYSRQELKARTKVFSKSLEVVDHCNEKEHFHCKLNQFSSMTDSEKSRYLGLGNITGTPAHAKRQAPVDRKKRSYASSVDWRDYNAVSPIKNQGACGACWAFAAAAAVEGTYAITTGKLKSFSDQELLECTYEGHVYDGCLGGWYFDAFDYLQKNQHLSTASTLPYIAFDGSCRNTGANGLIAGEATGFVKITEDAWSLSAAIEITPVAIAMLATGDFFSYSDGLYDGYYDCAGATYPNHALAAVAFTQDAFVVKNSWGSDWGEGGYISVARWANVCNINDYGYYLTMIKTGEDNSADDIVTPTSSPDGNCQEQTYDDDCVDYNSYCPTIKREGNCYKDYMLAYAQENCMSSCGFCNNIPLQDLAEDCVQRVSENTCSDAQTAAVCPLYCCDRSSDGGDDNGGCPSGTTLCGDGNCKHVHMC